MKKLLMMAFAALALAGCSVKKIEYTKNDKGEISYRIYENDHWLKTESTGIKGGMTGDGQFAFEAEGMNSSPSEEFNRTMQTYTTAFIQLAQIAAAAYNPATTGVQAKNEGVAAKVKVPQQAAACPECEESASPEAAK